MPETKNVSGEYKLRVNGTTCLHVTPDGISTPAAITGTTVTATTAVRLGHTSSISIAGASGSLQAAGTDAKANIAAIRYSDTAATSPNLLLGRARGTAVGTNAVVQNGDRLAAVVAAGGDGSSLVAAASITFEVDGTPGTNDMPGMLRFWTTADGAAASTARWRMSAGGDLLPETTEVYDIGSAALEVDNIYLQNAATVSDERAKENIADIGFGTDFIRALRPVTFKYKDVTVEQVDADGNVTEATIAHSRKHAGLIAQEVKAAMDGLGISTSDFAGYVDAAVNGGPDKLLLRPMQFIAPIIRALQEIDARVAALEP